MTTIRRGAVELDLPDNVAVAESQSAPRRRGSSAAAAEDTVSADSVADALRDQLIVVDTVPLRVDGPAAPRRRGGDSAAASAVLRVDIASDEHAVVLVEQDGFYSWVTGTKGIPPSTRRGPSRAVVTFEIPLDTEPAGAPPARRGPISDALIKPITTIVFKFLARLAIGQLVKRLERSIETGLVRIDQADPAQWIKSPPSAELALPDSRRPRLLLLVHGAFSSTRGGFGSFFATDTGKRFVERAVAGYDLVLGFDHRTLSEDPLENAEQMLEHLRTIDPGTGIDIDVVTHSRGALVARSLVEHLLGSDDDLVIRNVVMVAGPNAGTSLARPANWTKLIDLYTNLAIAACRLIALAAPPAATVTTVLRESLEALAIMVKAIVSEAADEQRVPGLAAMVPDGTFITDINRSDTQPHPISAAYYAVSSDFEVRDLEGPQELPAKLIRLVGDGLVDQLMGDANDLVVDVASMTAVDPGTPGMVRQTLALGDNPQTYHSSYFVRASVLQAIDDWLAGRTSDMRRGEDVQGPPDDTQPSVGEIVYRLPDSIDTNFTVMDADAPVGVALRHIEAGRPDFAVVRSWDAEGGVTHYAFRPDELVSLSADADAEATLSNAGILADHDASPETSSIRILPSREHNPEAPWTSRTVVLLDGSLVGVAPAVDESVTAPPPRRTRSAGPGRRGTTRGARPQEVPAEAEPATAQAYFRAETDAVVSTTAESLVLVDISRETLDGALGPSAKMAAAAIDTAMPITVHVVPRINLTVKGANHATVPPPLPGQPRSLRFSITGAHASPGQLLVIAGQGPVDLVKLVLDVTVVDGQPDGGGGRASVTAVLPPMPDVAACDQLIIDENKILALTGPKNDEREAVLQTRFDVRYQSESLDIVERAQTNPIEGDRLAYVTKLYQQIESDWGASERDARRFNRALRAYGGQLFDELLPESIQRVLWDNRAKIKQIQINSIEPLIPWEIVHLKGPNGRLPEEELFLASLGLVRWIDGARYAPRQVAVSHGHASAIIPSYPSESGWLLDEPANEFRFLEEAFGAQQVEADVETIMSLIEQPGKFDLLHFAGHGSASSNDISNAGLAIQVRQQGRDWVPVPLTATMVEQFANLRMENGNRPLVFLNACQVGRSAYQLTKVGGFAQAFLKGGAGIFVSTLWSVVDQPARMFTEEFYTELIGGKTVAEAAVAARQACRAVDDPTWLAYVVYGRPDGRLVIQ
jgi:hypothetical protein